MAGLYIHIPFCAKKCSYCDFISFEGKEREKAYIEAVIRELRGYNNEKIDTVFIGGGTPSYIGSEEIVRLLEAAYAHFSIDGNAEITIECNPSSLTAEKLDAYKEAGINRLSLGLQSAVDGELKMLGRLHDFSGFISTYEQARKYFDNINIDLISALPGQNWDNFLFSLQKTVELAPEHISVYSLIIDPDTFLGRQVEKGELKPVSEDMDRLIYHETGKFLSEAGYDRYEISNYAKQGRECAHNLNYWLSGDYIGLGCAAHSCYGEQRYHNYDNLEEYMRSPGEKQEIQLLEKKDRIAECIMLELRLMKGINRERFSKRFGTDIYDLYSKTIESLIRNGLMELTAESLKLTERGLDIADAVTLKFI